MPRSHSLKNTLLFLMARIATKLIVRSEHVRLLHAGPTTLLA